MESQCLFPVFLLISCQNTVAASALQSVIQMWTLSGVCLTQLAKQKKIQMNEMSIL